MTPLAGRLVVDLTRYLPGPFASRELLRLGARVVRLEPPGGDPMREIAPGWDAALNAGKESVVCDLRTEPELGHALCSRADVVLDGFRPGVTERLGVGYAQLPDTVVYCSITGFGSRHEPPGRPGYDFVAQAETGLMSTTSTTSAGPAHSWTRRRRSRPFRSPTSAREPWRPSRRSSPPCSSERESGADVESRSP